MEIIRMEGIHLAAALLTNALYILPSNKALCDL